MIVYNLCRHIKHSYLSSIYRVMNKPLKKIKIKQQEIFDAIRNSTNVHVNKKKYNRKKLNDPNKKH